jgi:deoxyhypusine monooxygenase
MLHDESPIVRHESAVALSSIGDHTVIPELKRAIDDKDEDVRNSALIAYEYLTYLQRKQGTEVAVVKSKIRL